MVASPVPTASLIGLATEIERSLARLKVVEDGNGLAYETEFFRRELEMIRSAAESLGDETDRLLDSLKPT